ncbi:MAG TPA: (2Fe-2S) ferredoxin domain-containing protein [Alphaproteobacteria bacterium]|nr:(2Fe-2S) ferredoxin domain-containing protein [Alphaproteobacteria bacterium]
MAKTPPENPEQIQESDPPYFFAAHVFCCTNTREDGHPRGCCSAKDSVALRDYMKSQVKARRVPNVRVNAAGCLDRCELGPTMVIYPEGVWYSYASEADLDEIIQTHLIDGGRVRRLLLNPRDAEPPR